MSTPNDPPQGGATSAAKTAGASKAGTVGVYDRPASADKPSMLPKVITALIVVAMLVLSYLFFWPKSTAPSSRDTPAPAATSAPADTTTGTGPGSAASTGAAPAAGSGGASATTPSK